MIAVAQHAVSPLENPQFVNWLGSSHAEQIATDLGIRLPQVNETVDNYFNSLDQGQRQLLIAFYTTIGSGLA